ncbi:hypothetical protein LCGC14_1950690 [marine sediment metagenome]|uniref:Homing endonuclease LAGLIDADG domain-containing protein n=1 Tax=marine sediment metagenome TaxID=412755 RepID=A0A0F9FHX0_9ZZZZ
MRGTTLEGCPDIITPVKEKRYRKTPSKNYFADEIELAYMAGTIDGEGSIMIVKQCESTRKNPCYVLSLSFVSTDKILAEWAQDRFGGNVIVCKTNNKKWKTAYRWQIRSGGALMILESILPFLIIKKEKAEYGICFQRERREPGKGGITKEELKKYEWYQLSIRKAG